MAGDETAGRAAREQAFYDRKSSRYAQLRRFIWRAIGAFRRTDDVHHFYDPAGKVVLDFGCGEGALSFTLLDRGAASVTGIDISNARIEEARRRAGAKGVGDRARFLVTDAHHTGFPEGTFDLVVGGDVLHHLEIEPALKELRRILRPGGRAVFVEPLAANPLLRLGRALTPSARTPDEHPLTEDDWDLCARYFEGFEHHEAEFLSIPLMPLNLVLRKRQQQALARQVGEWDDRLLRRFPGLRKHARITVLVLQ